MKRRYNIIAITIFAFLTFSCIGTAKGQHGEFNFRQPAIFDMDRLAEIRTRGTEAPEVLQLIKKADQMVAEKPVSVLDRKKTLAPDKHFYCGISRYSWPSDTDPQVYVIKDGKSNPEWKDYNRPQLQKLADRLKYLSVAYYITRDLKYYDAFNTQVDVWFLDEDTYMYPNLEYSQVQLGKYGNKGAPYGLADISYFTPIIESMFLVNTVKQADVDREIKKWFSDFADWVLNDTRWEKIKKPSNNIVSTVYVSLIEMARFTDNANLVERLSEEYTKNVLDAQIDEVGKQPAELRRAYGFGYSVGNLSHIIDFCLIMEQSGVHYYKENQKKIDSAFEYLIQFIGNKEAFPYNQNGGWERYEKKLENNISRLTRLSSKRSHVSRMSKRKKYSQTSIMDYVYYN